MNSLRKILMVIIVISLAFTLFGEDRPPERIARELMVEGQNNFNNRNYAEAITNFEASLNIFKEIRNEMTSFDEEIRQILFNLFASGANSQNNQIATKYGEELLVLDPGNERLVGQLAQIYRVRMSDMTRAINVWKRFDEQFNRFSAKREIGDLYVRAEDNTNALLWFNRALEQNRDADLLQRIASLHISMNQPDRAIRVYRDFLDTNPPARERNITLRNMGTLYRDQNNTRLAIQYYEQFLEHDWDRNIALWLVSQFEELKNYPRALHWIQAMITRNSNDLDAIYFRALIAHAEGRLVEARADFQRLTAHATYGNSARQFIESIDAQN